MIVIFALVLLVLVFFFGYLMGAGRYRVAAVHRASKKEVVPCRGRRAVFRRLPMC